MQRGFAAVKALMHIINLKTKRGFSLVELVASMVIAGILAISLLTVVVTALDGYFFARDTADISQKAQLALARMRIELLNLAGISTATADKIVFTNPQGTYELERTGTVITLTQNSTTAILVDNIPASYGADQLFDFQKVPASGAWSIGTDTISELYAIDITLKFSDFNGVFQTTINPRANSLRVAPRLL